MSAWETVRNHSDIFKMGHNSEERWEGWETVPSSRKDNNRRSKSSIGSPNSDSASVGSKKEGNGQRSASAMGGGSTGNGAGNSLPSAGGLKQQRGGEKAPFDPEQQMAQVVQLTDEEAMERLPGMLNEFILSKCESSEHCRRSDFDGTAREALQRISFLQALQAIEHFAGSVSARIQKRPAYLMGILRGQEQHWDKSRAAASLPGGSAELLALPPMVLVTVAELCLQGNCLPSDFTPEVCLSLHRLSGPLGVKAIHAFNSNKRIGAGNRGGVLNRPRFFQRLIQNVAEQSATDDGNSTSANATNERTKSGSTSSTPTNEVGGGGNTSTNSSPTSSGSSTDENNTAVRATKPSIGGLPGKIGTTAAAIVGNGGKRRAKSESASGPMSSSGIALEKHEKDENQPKNAWSSPLAAGNIINETQQKQPWGNNNTNTKKNANNKDIPDTASTTSTTNEETSMDETQSEQQQQQQQQPPRIIEEQQQKQHRDSWGGANNGAVNQFGSMSLSDSPNGPSPPPPPGGGGGANNNDGGFFANLHHASAPSTPRTGQTPDDSQNGGQDAVSHWQTDHFSTSLVDLIGGDTTPDPNGNQWSRPPSTSFGTSTSPPPPPGGMSHPTLQRSHTDGWGANLNIGGLTGDMNHYSTPFQVPPPAAASSSLVGNDDQTSYMKQIRMLTEKVEKLQAACQQLHEENVSIKTKHKNLVAHLRQVLETADLTSFTPLTSKDPSSHQ